MYVVIKTSRQEELGPENEYLHVFDSLEDANAAAEEQMDIFDDPLEYSTRSLAEDDGCLEIVAHFREYDEETICRVVKKQLPASSVSESESGGKAPIVYVVLQEDRLHTEWDEIAVISYHSGQTEANEAARCSALGFADSQTKEEEEDGAISIEVTTHTQEKVMICTMEAESERPSNPKSQTVEPLAQKRLQDTVVFHVVRTSSRPGKGGSTDVLDVYADLEGANVAVRRCLTDEHGFDTEWARYEETSDNEGFVRVNAETKDGMEYKVYVEKKFVKQASYDKIGESEVSPPSLSVYVATKVRFGYNTEYCPESVEVLGVYGDVADAEEMIRDCVGVELDECPAWNLFEESTSPHITGSNSFELNDSQEDTRMHYTIDRQTVQ